MSDSGDQARESRRPAQRADMHRHDRDRQDRAAGKSDTDSGYRRKFEYEDDEDSDDSRRRRQHQDPGQRSGDGSRHERKYREHSRSRARTHRRRRSRSRSRSRSPYKRQKKTRPSSPDRRPSHSPPRRSRAPLPSQDESFNGTNPVLDADGKPIVKQKPNFKPTGLLSKEANTVAGTTTVLKYHEPPEARKPPSREQWRMYVFKGKEVMDTVYLYSRSVWLMGRDEKVTDMLLEHPSISKQHAVIQFRHITSTNEFGDRLSKVKPYLIDLDSANGTKLNGKKIEGSRYVELVDGDVVAVGDSEREYVLMLPPTDN